MFAHFHSSDPVWDSGEEDREVLGPDGGEGGREAQGLGLARVVAVVLWGRLGFVRCGGAQCLVLGGFCYLVASPCCVAVLVVGVDVASAVLE